jgi:hypothetical protein
MTFVENLLLSLLKAISSAILIRDITKFRSAAGISLHFVSISCCATAFMILSSSFALNSLVLLIQLCSDVILWYVIQSGFPHGGDHIRALRYGFPIVFILSVPATYYGSLFHLCRALALWLSVIGLACQVLLLMKSHNIIILNRFVPFFLGAAVLEVYTSLRQSFTVESPDAWVFWLTGIAKFLLCLDFLYYFVSAKANPSLPLSFGML